MSVCLYLSIWLQLDPSTGRQKKPNHDKQDSLDGLWDGRTRKKKSSAPRGKRRVKYLPFASFSRPLSVFYVVVYVCVRQQSYFEHSFFFLRHTCQHSTKRGRVDKEERGGNNNGPHGTYSWYDTRTHTWARQAKQAPQKRANKCSL